MMSSALLTAMMSFQQCAGRRSLGYIPFRDGNVYSAVISTSLRIKMGDYACGHTYWPVWREYVRGAYVDIGDYVVVQWLTYVVGKIRTYCALALRGRDAPDWLFGWLVDWFEICGAHSKYVMMWYILLRQACILWYLICYIYLGVTTFNHSTNKIPKLGSA